MPILPLLLHLLPLPVVHVLVAPYFHPTSSCLWQQLGVLWWWPSSSPHCRGCCMVGVLGHPCCPCPICCHCCCHFCFCCPPPQFAPLSLSLLCHCCCCSACSPSSLSLLFPVFTPEVTVVVPHNPHPHFVVVCPCTPIHPVSSCLWQQQ